MLKYVVKVQVRAAQARSERGSAVVEYGLLVALVSIAVMAGVTAMGGALTSVYLHVIAELGLPTTP